jgi:hypothetical protein
MQQDISKSVQWHRCCKLAKYIDTLCGHSIVGLYKFWWNPLYLATVTTIALRDQSYLHFPSLTDHEGRLDRHEGVPL